MVPIIIFITRFVPVSPEVARTLAKSALTFKEAVQVILVGAVALLAVSAAFWWAMQAGHR